MKLRRSAAVLAATAVVTVGASSAALAAADPTDVTVTGGSLSITQVNATNFAGVTLDGTAKTTTATADNFSVTDARGSGAGWNVTAQATQFKEWDSTLNAGAGGYTPSGRTLALSSLSMPAPTVAANGTTSASPSITAGPYAIDAAGAVKIASAAVGAGMGKYDFTQGGSLSLSIPASAYAKTYRSELTVSVVTGP